MKRNPVVPFVIIMVFGIVLVLVLSFKGLGDMKEVAKDSGKQGGGKTEVAVSVPNEIYKNTCVGCHGDQYQGGVGPALKGIGGKLTKDQIKEVITKGKGTMPPNMVKPEDADKMAEWVSNIK